MKRRSQREETRDLEAMASAAATVVDGIDRRSGAWLCAVVDARIDASGGLEGIERARALDAAHAAVDAARGRVVVELRHLFALHPLDQRVTPLEIVRGLRHEPTSLLDTLGVRPVRRDRVEATVLPDDPFGLAPRSLAELGDPALGEALLVWGVCKARVLARRASPPRG
jgi:hypothetical protein